MNELIIGEMYTHFKTKDVQYKIIDIAMHTETGEKLVIYQAMGGEHIGKLYARPYDMFLEEVPKDKENPTGQIYRFELIKKS